MPVIADNLFVLVKVQVTVDQYVQIDDLSAKITISISGHGESVYEPDVIKVTYDRTFTFLKTQGIPAVLVDGQGSADVTHEIRINTADTNSYVKNIWVIGFFQGTKEVITSHLYEEDSTYFADNGIYLVNASWFENYQNGFPVARYGNRETEMYTRNSETNVDSVQIHEDDWTGPFTPTYSMFEDYSSSSSAGQVKDGLIETNRFFTTGDGADFRNAVKIRKTVSIERYSEFPNSRGYGKSHEESKWNPETLQLLEHRKDKVIWQMDYSIDLEWDYRSILTELHDETSGDFISRTAWADDSWLGGEHWGTSSFYYEGKVNGLTTDLFSRNIDYDDGLGTCEPHSALLFSCAGQACEGLQFIWGNGGYFILGADYLIEDVGDLRAWYQIFEITELGLAHANNFSYATGYPEIPDGWIRWVV